MTEPPAPSSKIRAVLAELADLSQEAEQEARTVTELKTQTTKLKRELTLANKRAAQAGIPDVEVKRREKAAAAEARRQALAEKPVAGGNPKHTKVLEQIARIASRVLESDLAPIPTHFQPKSTQRSLSAQPSVDGLKKAERLILRAFYWLKDEEADKAKVSFYSGYKAGSGSFNNALGKLRTAGLLDGWEITEAGIEIIPGDIGYKPTGEELREWLRPKLNKAENTMLDVLCGVYPEKLNNTELSIRTGYSEGSGSFNNALGKLRSLEAAEGYARSGGVKASCIFFEQAQQELSDAN